MRNVTAGSNHYLSTTFYPYRSPLTGSFSYFSIIFSPSLWTFETDVIREKVFDSVLMKIKKAFIPVVVMHQLFELRYTRFELVS